MAYALRCLFFLAAIVGLVAFLYVYRRKTNQIVAIVLFSYAVGAGSRLLSARTDEEVVRVRNQIRAGLLMSLESPSSRAGQLARQQILWGRPIPLQETVDRINRRSQGRLAIARLIGGGKGANEAHLAMMDLGSAVCLPAEPRCGSCPLQYWCASATPRALQRHLATPRSAAR